MLIAKYFLFLYHNAYCVVTPRLHVALTATAFGTPVCMLKGGNLIRKKRFDGLEDLFNEVDIDDFIRSNVYDVNDSSPNPTKYLEMSKALAETCKGFTGYDSKKSVFESTYNPMIELAQLLKYDKRVISKITLFESRKKLFGTLLERTFQKKTSHDSEV